MRIGLTGATGFIGRHVLSRLISENIDLVAITRNPSGLASFNRRIKIVQCDLTNPNQEAIDLLANCNSLIHLAWDGLPNYLSQNHFEIELPLQNAFLERLIRAGLKSLVVSGTCLEYGMLNGSLHEELNCNPSNPYSLAKLALLRRLEYMRSQVDFSLSWARLFYMFGTGQSENSLYSQFRKAGITGQRVFNMSGGEQIRDFLAVTEVARRIVFLAKNSTDAGVVNICSGVPRSVREIVEEWRASEGWEMSLNLGYYPYPSWEPMSFWGDTSKFNAFESKTSQLNIQQSSYTT